MPNPLLALPSRIVPPDVEGMAVPRPTASSRLVNIADGTASSRPPPPSQLVVKLRDAEPDQLGAVMPSLSDLLNERYRWVAVQSYGPKSVS